MHMHMIIETQWLIKFFNEKTMCYQLHLQAISWHAFCNKTRTELSPNVQGDPRTKHTPFEKAKPVVRRGRKATGLKQKAGLPKKIHFIGNPFFFRNYKPTIFPKN